MTNGSTPKDASEKGEIYYELDDGARGQVTNMLDCDGEETDDLDEALMLVVAHPDGSWWSVEADLNRIEQTERTIH